MTWVANLFTLTAVSAPLKNFPCRKAALLYAYNGTHCREGDGDRWES